MIDRNSPRTVNLLETTKALIDAFDEDARRKLKDFIAILIHEIRTPVTSIEGFSNILLEGKRGELSEEQKMALHRIQRQSERIKNLLDVLVKLS